MLGYLGPRSDLGFQRMQQWLRLNLAPANGLFGICARSNLIDRGRLDQIVGEFLQKEPTCSSRRPLPISSFAQNILTGFQAERLLAGQDAGFRPWPVHAHGCPRLRPAAWGPSTRRTTRPTTNGTPSRSCRAGACGTSTLSRARKVRSFEQCKHPRRPCRSWTSAPRGACTTSPGRWSKAKRSTTRRATPGETLRGRRRAALPCTLPRDSKSAISKACVFHGLLKPSNIMIGPVAPGLHSRFRHRLLVGRDRRGIAGRYDVHRQFGDEWAGLL